MIFLETMSVDGVSVAAIMAFLAAFMAVLAVVGVLVWVYTSWAFMSIGRKVGHPTPGLAWIPIVGPGLIAHRAAKMHWWPLLLLIGIFVPVVSPIFSLAFVIFFTIWLWKTLEAIKKPGWWSLLIMFVPVVNIIMLGVAAWSK